MGRNRVKLLQTGYCTSSVDDTTFTADCTVSLVTGDFPPILVDTSGPWNAKKLQSDLQMNGYTTEDIQTVVCTHGHSDHVGNINLFPHAKFIVGYDVFRGNVYEAFDFKSEAACYSLNDDVKVIPTPGHTHADVSVIVSNTDRGTIVIAGDIFESEDDLSDSSLWKSLSEDIKLQQRSRQLIFSIADYIVPGHGDIFSTSACKRSDDTMKA